MLHHEFERGIEEARLKQSLRTADKIVWQQAGFPAVHHPDVNTLLSNISIGKPNSTSLKIHPDMRSEFHEAFERQLAARNADRELYAIGWYDNETRNITISPDILKFSDDIINKTLYFEAAADISMRKTITKPEDYTRNQEKAIRKALAMLFDKKRRPWIEETILARSGFRTVIQSGEYSIIDLAEVPPEYIPIYNQIYPTVHEVITDQIVKLEGDIHAFERNAKHRELQILPSEGHKNFVNALFNLLPFVNWRNILYAFKTGDIDKTREYLKNVNPHAEIIIRSLVMGMQIDEQLIRQVKW